MNEIKVVFKATAEAARRTDEEFYRQHPELEGRKLTFSPKDGPLRREWMDLYVGFGGKHHEIGSSRIRIAPIHVEGQPVERADRRFFDRHPEREGEPLTFAESDGLLRREWMDLYIEEGGDVVAIGNSGIRIPRQ